MLKYLVILLAAVALIWWWWAQRRALIRDAMRRNAQLPTELEKCPKCGVFAPKGEHSCG